MGMIGNMRLELFIVCIVVSIFSGCTSSKQVTGDTAGSQNLESQVRRFRNMVEKNKHEEARGLMVAQPRRWWESRDGEGKRWAIGSKGRWADWDRNFRSESDIVEWKQGLQSVTAVVRETNDYFRLLERGWVTTEMTYYFTPSGKIEGLLIRAVGERPPGRTPEFLTWARANDPVELEAIMPEGEIDPTNDHPGRMRTLLNRWRESVGLGQIK